jgi:long-subunit fatty acid transport protein
MGTSSSRRAEGGGGSIWACSTRFQSGYVYYINPVPDRSLSPDNPDSNQHNLMFGIGYQTGKFVIDAFYNFAFYVERKVTNSILSGKYKGFVNAAGISIGYHFGEGNEGNSTPQKMTNDK